MSTQEEKSDKLFIDKFFIKAMGSVHKGMLKKQIIRRVALEKGTFMDDLKEMDFEEIVQRIYSTERGGALFSDIPMFDEADLTQKAKNQLRLMRREVLRMKTKPLLESNVPKITKKIQKFVEKNIKIPEEAKVLMQNSNKLKGKLKTSYTFVKLFILLNMIPPTAVVEMVGGVLSQIAGKTSKQANFLTAMTTKIKELIVGVDVPMLGEVAIRQEDRQQPPPEPPQPPQQPDVKIDIDKPDVKIDVNDGKGGQGDPPDGGDDGGGSGGDLPSNDNDDGDDNIGNSDFNLKNIAKIFLTAVIGYYTNDVIKKLESLGEKPQKLLLDLEKLLTAISTRGDLTKSDKKKLKKLFKNINSNDKQSQALKNFLKKELKSNENLHLMGQSFTGAGTRVVGKILQEEFTYPRSELDSISMLHDIFYLSSDPDVRRIADLKYMKQSKKIIGNPEADAARFAIQTKMDLEDIFGSLDYFGMDLSGVEKDRGTATQEDIDTIFSIGQAYTKLYESGGLKFEDNNRGVYFENNENLNTTQFDIDFQDIKDRFQKVLTKPSFDIEDDDPVVNITMSPDDEKFFNPTNITTENMTSNKTMPFMLKLKDEEGLSLADINKISKFTKADIRNVIIGLGATEAQINTESTKMELMDNLILFRNQDLKEGQIPIVRIKASKTFKATEVPNTGTPATNDKGNEKEDNEKEDNEKEEDQEDKNTGNEKEEDQEDKNTDNEKEDNEKEEGKTGSKTDMPTGDGLEGAIRDLINVIKISTEDIDDDKNDGNTAGMDDQIDGFNDLSFSANNPDSKEQVDNIKPTKNDQDASNVKFGLNGVVTSSLWRPIGSTVNQDRIIKKRMEFSGFLDTGTASIQNVKSNYRGMPVDMRNIFYNRKDYRDKFQGTMSELTPVLNLVQSRAEFYNNMKFNPEGAPWRFPSTRKVAM
jgi:hypothetical protein